LILCIFDSVIDETVSEKNRVVCHLELADGLTNANFELLLCLDSITDAMAQFLEARWVDEEEVALQRLSVDLDGAFNIDLDDGDFAG